MHIALVLTFLLVASSSSLNGQCDILLWEDNFEATEVNPLKWDVQLDNSGGGNDELQYYTPRDTNVYIDNGRLVIRALEEDFRGWSYTSGKLITRGLADWRYGRMEASIKMPAGQGMWPAFWMLPTENKYGGWPNSGEIDIVELIGQDTNTVYGTIHYGPPWKYTNGMYSLEEGAFSDTTHVFAIEWSESSIDWYVDDVLYSSKTADSLRRPEQWKVFQERFYLILNLAVGGNWPGDPDETTVFPQTMEVDYVRAYGDPSIQEIIAADSAYANAAGVTYSFTDIPGASFNWTLPAGATIVNGQGTNMIEVDWGCTPGDIKLDVSNIDCADQAYTLPVEFATMKISGKESIFPLSELSLQVPALNETTYSWSFPDDVVQIAGDSDTLRLKWGCTEGYVKVTAQNNCTTLSDSLLVNLLTPSVSGPSTVAENSKGVIYAVDSIPDTQYTWSVPSDASIVSGQGTDSIAADFGMEAGLVSVEISNACYNELLELVIRITDTLVLADYETTSPVFETFANTTFEKVENPAPDEVNSSSNVGKSLKSEVAWAGIYTDLGYNLDMTKHKKFTLKVLGPKAGEVLLKLEDIDVGTVQSQEVSASYTNVNSWQQLEFIFPDAVNGAFDRVTLFFDFGSEDENIYYFDDLSLMPWEDPSFTPGSTSNAMRIYPVPAGQALHYEFDYIPSDSKIEIFDMQGRLLMSHVTDGKKGTLNIEKFARGTYLLVAGNNDQVYKTLFIK